MSSLGARPCLWSYIAGSTAWLLLTAEKDATSKDKSIDVLYFDFIFVQWEQTCESLCM